MSTYAVNCVGRRVVHDEVFRAELGHGPDEALANLALTEDERDALLRGDVAWLYEHGAHEYLLMNIARFGRLGLNFQLFSERIRAATPRIE